MGVSGFRFGVRGCLLRGPLRDAEARHSHGEQG